MKLSVETPSGLDLIRVEQQKYDDEVGAECGEGVECALDTSERKSLLFTSIQKQSWVYAMKCLKSSPSDSSTWGEKLDKDGQILWKRLPIHEACMHNPPSEFLEALLKAYPNGTMCKDLRGRLPIHLACVYGASPDTIAKLLLAYPESVSVKDDSGNSPLQSFVGVHGEDNMDAIDILSKPPLFFILQNHDKKRDLEEEKKLALVRNEEEEKFLLQLGKIKEQNALLTKEVTSLKETLESREEENESLKVELKSTQEEGMELINKISILEENVDCIVSESHSDKEMITSLQKELQDLKEMKTRDDAEAKKEIETLTNRVSELESEMNEKEVVISGLTTQAEEQSQAMKELETASAEKEDQSKKRIETLESELETSKESLKTLQEECKAQSENHSDEIKKAETAFKNKVVELVKVEIQLEKEMEKSHDIRRRALGEARAMRTIFSNLKTEASDMRSNQKKQKKLNELTSATLAAKEEELFGVSQELVEANTELMKLQNRLDDAIAELEESKEAHQKQMEKVSQRLVEVTFQGEEEKDKFIQTETRLNAKIRFLSNQLELQINLTDNYKEETEKLQTEMDLLSASMDKFLDQQLQIFQETTEEMSMTQEMKEKDIVYEEGEGLGELGIHEKEIRFGKEGFEEPEMDEKNISFESDGFEVSQWT